MKVLEFKGVWEKYRIKFIQQKNVFWEEFWALEDINLEVNRGQVIGIIGENGAGKTTLLKLIAGMLVPDRGEVHVHGKVSALMELGAGFNPEFTGRENIMLNARIYGLDEDLLKQRMDEVTEFAGLGKFIDAPIKYYSQGMYMRLAFALAIYVEPDILLIDDILAVGDEEAQQKCIKKIFQLKQSGKTIVVVSHNMNMIERLCNQVILLERGKIVHKGLPQDVIPRYQEVVGDKKGIAILEKEKLRLVFNNGRIVINYDGTTLTEGNGGYVSFFVPSLNSWVASFNLEWRIKNSLPNELIAEGLYQDGAIAQIWIVRIGQDQLQWQVEVRDNSITEPHIDLLLVPEYKGWASLERDGEFGLFAHKSNWQEVGLDNYQDNIVGIRADLQKNNLPFLTFEIKNKDSQLKLLNTGYNQEARVIQSYLIEGNYISLRIKIFSAIDIFEEYIRQFRNEFLLKQQQQQASQRALRTISSGNLRLFADLENKTIRLYYKDKEITKSSSLCIAFLFNQTWFDASLCNWQVKRQGDKLILNLYWEQLKLTQLWRFSLKDNSLIWQVDSESEQPLDFKVLKFGLYLISEYKTFFCDHQQGDFPEEFTHWQDMVLEEPKAEMFGLRKQANLPAVVLENKQDFSCLIQNSDTSASCRTLQLSLPGQALKQKKHFSFSTKVKLLEDETLIDDYIKEQEQRRLIKQQEELALRTISSGNLRLFADLENKAIRLYYKDKEITKGKGLYTAMHIKGEKKWISSYDAKWQINKNSDKEIVLTLDYMLLPLQKIWRLRLREDNTFEYEMVMEVKKQIPLIEQAIKLEVGKEYKDWETAFEKGDFLVNKYNNNIAPIRLKDSNVSQVILKSEINNHFPHLFFRVYSQNNKHIFNIYKLRETDEECICLDYSTMIPKKEILINPGRYTDFEGKEFKSEGKSFVIKLEKMTIIQKIKAFFSKLFS